jgi:predicted ATPase/DNA-binding CsgD family transcriptional regulator
MSSNPSGLEVDREPFPIWPLPDLPLAQHRRLPIPLSPIIGREREIAAIERLIRDTEVRLVTLTGTAGAGKTRLALRVAQDLAVDFRDGTALVELAQVREPALVAKAVAEVLGVTERIGQSPVASVQAYLKDRSFLLVLDNFEHLSPVAPLVTNWLSGCGGLSVLVTSRAALRVSGEHDVVVAPLAVPDLENLPTHEDLAKNPAVRLFVARAIATRSDFTLTQANSAAVAAICARLDGLPLAIELAAARMQHLPPHALLARLDHRLPLLRGGPVDQPERLRTLENAIAWSYELLTSDEQALFRGLSVFVGGFGLDAAEAIWSDDCGVLDGIASLVRTSLLQPDPRSDEEPRYRMLQTVREYGLDRLSASKDLDEIRSAHASYFVELAERADDAVYGGPNHRLWLDRLELDLPNLRAALEWLDESHAYSLLLRLAAALGGLWHYRSHRVEGRAWLIRALEGDAKDVPAARATALVKLAMLERNLSGTLGADMASEALALRRALGDERPIGRSLLLVASLHDAEGDFDAARQCRKEAEAIFERIDDKFGLARCRFRDGIDARNLGEIERARALMLEALSLFRQDGFPYGMTQVLVTLGELEADCGNRAEAAAHYCESVRLWNETLSSEQLIDTVAAAGRLAFVCGNPADATRLLSFATSLGAAADYQGPTDECEQNDRVLLEARTKLGEERFAAVWSAGAVRAVDAMLIEAEEILIALAGNGKPDRSEITMSPGGLTKRELSVVRLVAKGMSNRQIAQDLFISESTTISHVSNIMAKLELGSRTAVAAWAIHQGLG